MKSRRPHDMKNLQNMKIVKKTRIDYTGWVKRQLHLKDFGTSKTREERL